MRSIKTAQDHFFLFVLFPIIFCSCADYGQPGGLNFTSTEFQYNLKSKKKGGWDITIKPTDIKDVRQMFLSIGENGYASLQVISNNRQTISYYGYITEK